MQTLEIYVIGFLTDVSHKVKGQGFQETCFKLEDGTDCCSGRLVMPTNRFWTTTQEPRPHRLTSVLIEEEKS